MAIPYAEVKITVDGRDLQQQVDDKHFAQEIRRGLITIARACAARYAWGKVLLIVLGVDG